MKIDWLFSNKTLLWLFAIGAFVQFALLEVKLRGIVAWSWWWVMSPTVVVVSIIAVLLVIVAAILRGLN